MALRVTTFRKVIRWRSLAPYVSSVKIAFDPADTTARGVKEFWRVAAGQKIRKAFPKYTVDVKVAYDMASPLAEISLVNGKSVKVPATNLTADDLMARIYDSVSELESKAALAGESVEK